MSLGMSQQIIPHESHAEIRIDARPGAQGEKAKYTTPAWYGKAGTLALQIVQTQLNVEHEDMTSAREGGMQASHAECLCFAAKE